MSTPSSELQAIMARRRKLADGEDEAETAVDATAPTVVANEIAPPRSRGSVRNKTRLFNAGGPVSPRSIKVATDLQTIMARRRQWEEQTTTATTAPARASTTSTAGPIISTTSPHTTNPPPAECNEEDTQKFFLQLQDAQSPEQHREQYLEKTSNTTGTVQEDQSQQEPQSGILQEKPASHEKDPSSSVASHDTRWKPHPQEIYAKPIPDSDDAVLNNSIQPTDQEQLHSSAVRRVRSPLRSHWKRPDGEEKNPSQVSQVRKMRESLERVSSPVERVKSPHSWKRPTDAPRVLSPSPWKKLVNPTTDRLPNSANEDERIVTPTPDILPAENSWERPTEQRGSVNPDPLGAVEPSSKDRLGEPPNTSTSTNTLVEEKATVDLQISPDVETLATTSDLRVTTEVKAEKPISKVRLMKQSLERAASPRPEGTIPSPPRHSWGRTSSPWKAHRGTTNGNGKHLQPSEESIGTTANRKPRKEDSPTSSEEQDSSIVVEEQNQSRWAQPKAGATDVKQLGGSLIPSSSRNRQWKRPGSKPELNTNTRDITPAQLSTRPTSPWKQTTDSTPECSENPPSTCSVATASQRLQQQHSRTKQKSPWHRSASPNPSIRRSSAFQELQATFQSPKTPTKKWTRPSPRPSSTTPNSLVFPSDDSTLLCRQGELHERTAQRGTTVKETPEMQSPLVDEVSSPENNRSLLTNEARKSPENAFPNDVSPDALNAARTQDAPAHSAEVEGEQPSRQCLSPFQQLQATFQSKSAATTTTTPTWKKPQTSVGNFSVEPPSGSSNDSVRISSSRMSDKSDNESAAVADTTNHGEDDENDVVPHATPTSHSSVLEDDPFVYGSYPQWIGDDVGPNTGTDKTIVEPTTEIHGHELRDESSTEGTAPQTSEYTTSSSSTDQRQAHVWLDTQQHDDQSYTVEESNQAPTSVGPDYSSEHEADVSLRPGNRDAVVSNLFPNNVVEDTGFFDESEPKFAGILQCAETSGQNLIVETGSVELDQSADIVETASIESNQSADNNKLQPENSEMQAMEDFHGSTNSVENLGIPPITLTRSSSDENELDSHNLHHRNFQHDGSNINSTPLGISPRNGRRAKVRRGSPRRQQRKEVVDTDVPPVLTRSMPDDGEERPVPIKRKSLEVEVSASPLDYISSSDEPGFFSTDESDEQGLRKRRRQISPQKKSVIPNDELKNTMDVQHPKESPNEDDEADGSNTVINHGIPLPGGEPESSIEDFHGTASCDNGPISNPCDDSDGPNSIEETEKEQYVVPVRSGSYAETEESAGKALLVAEDGGTEKDRATQPNAQIPHDGSPREDMLALSDVSKDLNEAYQPFEGQKPFHETFASFGTFSNIQFPIFQSNLHQSELTDIEDSNSNAGSFDDTFAPTAEFPLTPTTDVHPQSAFETFDECFPSFADTSFPSINKSVGATESTHMQENTSTTAGGFSFQSSDLDWSPIDSPPSIPQRRSVVPHERLRCIMNLSVPVTNPTNSRIIFATLDDQRVILREVDPSNNGVTHSTKQVLCPALARMFKRQFEATPCSIRKVWSLACGPFEQSCHVALLVDIEVLETSTPVRVVLLYRWAESDEDIRLLSLNSPPGEF